MVAAATVGAAVVGGAISARGSKSAAGTQADAARDSARLQKEMYDQTREDYAPYRQAGYSGLNKLGYLLGLDQNGYQMAGGGFGGTSAMLPAPPVAPQPGNYNKGGRGITAYNQDYIRWNQLSADKKRTTPKPVLDDYLAGKGGTTSDAKYQAELKKYNADLAKYNQQVKSFQASMSGGKGSPIKDSEYGSLLRSFGLKDFQTDPGYQFRMDEGIKGLDRSAAARGGLLSGAALKGINRFSQDFASNEYGNAYNRFNQDQSNKFNRLAAIAGIGQTSTGQVAQAGQNYATGAGNAMMGAGNAMAAGQVGSANAISGALNNVSQYNMMNSMLNQPSNQGLTQPQSFAPWGGGTNDYQGYY